MLIRKMSPSGFGAVSIGHLEKGKTDLAVKSPSVYDILLGALGIHLCESERYIVRRRKERTHTSKSICNLGDSASISIRLYHFTKGPRPPAKLVVLYIWFQFYNQ